MTQDYRDTVFLPKTDFPMKAGLPQKEPEILKYWQAQDVYGSLRKARAGRETFILHDGPPYANGDIHIGHALNKTLKDMVVRTQSALGKDVPYVPGWDCHGLPIEWKIEEQCRKKKRNKDDVPVKEFRAECRAYAADWVDKQRAQMLRLGVIGEYANPYLTMASHAEGTIVSELLRVAQSGQLYRGAKPVMWSCVEKTALAEAEVEYENITSTQIDVAFEMLEAPNCPAIQALLDKGEKVHAAIWTTTPWTIPVNQGIAYGAEVEYVLLPISKDGQDFRVIIATDLQHGFLARMGLDSGKQSQPIVSLKGAELAGAIAHHPMARRIETPLPFTGGAGGGQTTEEEMPTPNPSRKREGNTGIDPSRKRDGNDVAPFFARPRPFLDGSDFVTTDAGTGLVHMAPDHGEDDFALCKAHGIEPVFAVEADGKYRADWVWLGGQGSVINPKFNASGNGSNLEEGPICKDLRESGALLAASDNFAHSYPHSWRSKAKLIYRATPQWFVAMDKTIAGGFVAMDKTIANQATTLRETAMAAIAATRFIPEKGRNRIGSMVEGRPDWVLSRQRAWGVPITLFVHKQTGQYLNDAQVNARIVAAVKAQGVDAWEAARAQEFLGGDYLAADYEMVQDILDVWFDSGCTHVFTLESGHWPEQKWPADLYLEGSDQHRGWFQSSLLESCATRGRAPYKAVFTHGFTMDSKGEKMSKSKGNTIDPLKLMETYGADILRLWALSIDYTEDHRIGDEILKGVADQYRKLRNTLRYMLGALDGFDSEREQVEAAAMPELEQYMLHLLGELDAKLRTCIDNFEFNTYVRLIIDFCNNDLSAFFFDIRKDTLYCDVNPASGFQSEKRRAYRTLLDILFHSLVRYAAPVLVFTAEEVWRSRFPHGGSIHLQEWHKLPFATHNPALAEKWGALRALRASVTEAIEPYRRDKTIGSSLEADVAIPAQAHDTDFAELFISGAVQTHDGEAFSITKTTHHKCGRCWRHLPEVDEDGALCGRCAEVLAA